MRANDELFYLCILTQALYFQTRKIAIELIRFKVKLSVDLCAEVKERNSLIDKAKNDVFLVFVEDICIYKVISFVVSILCWYLE